MVLLIQYTLIYATVLTLVALGGMFSERSGVINIGLEGIMVFGAMGGAMTMVLLPENSPAALTVILVLIMSALIGMVSSLLLAVACINFNADQTLAGTAINMLATAGATVIIKAFNTSRSNGSDFSAKLDYILPRKAFVFNVDKIGVIPLLLFVLLVVFVFLLIFTSLRKTINDKFTVTVKKVKINYLYSLVLLFYIVAFFLIYCTGIGKTIRNCLVIPTVGLELNVYFFLMLFLLILSSVILYKTRFGLRLRSCGEHPQAADSVGINVYKMRYAGVLISGFLGGIGGIVYISAANGTWHFDMGVAGAGFLALAVMIFGQWKPHRIALAALLFGLFRALSNVYMGFDFLSKIKIDGTVYNMLPYIVSLLVLAFTSKKSRAPKAEGIPYDKGLR